MSLSISVHGECRDALKNALADAHATGPDENGWFSVLSPDGGAVEICLRRLDKDPAPDACTVILRKLSPEAAQFLYRLMSEGGLILFPPIIAASKTVAETVDAPWPNVMVVRSASELHGVLSRGPYEWWSRGREEGPRPDTL